jgi:hypothetical protein
MSLSENSISILNQLESENLNFLQTNQFFSSEAVDAEILINTYEDSTSKLDKVQEVYNLLGQINSKKQQIVDLCSNAFTNSTCTLEKNEKLLYGDGKILDIEIISASSGGTDGTYSNVTPEEEREDPQFNAIFTVVRQNGNITSISISNAGEGYLVRDVLTINGTDIGMPEDGSDYDLILEVTRTDEDELVFSETGKTFRVGGLTPFTPVAFGVIRRDDIRVVYYLALEDQTSLPQSDNLSDGLIFPLITSGSTNSEFRGKGRATILSENSSFNDGIIDHRIEDDAGSWNPDGVKRGSGWSGGDNILGKFYKLKSACGTTRSQINTLSGEIASLRAQINDLLSPINVLKNKKHKNQLKSWAFRRNKKTNLDNIDQNTSLESIINDPSYSDIFETP